LVFYNLYKAKAYNIPFVETSAKESTNTTELFKNTMITFIEKTNCNSKKADEYKKRNTIIIDLDKAEQKDDNCCLK
jgi:hypothetical protein